MEVTRTRPLLETETKEEPSSILSRGEKGWTSMAWLHSCLAWWMVTMGRKCSQAACTTEEGLEAIAGDNEEEKEEEEEEEEG